VSSPQDPATEGSSADHSRSGNDIAEAIGVAEAGSSVQEVHDRGPENTSGHAPVEQTAGDPEMTEGQVVLGDGEPGENRTSGPMPDEQTSGAAQSVQGARTSDRVAAGEGHPPDPSA
jgi:hypothetical protein